MQLRIAPGRPLRGEARLPGDKSLAHRALIAAALAEGESIIRGFDPFDDAHATVAALRACGVRIEPGGLRALRVWGRGLRGLAQPQAPLDCGLSGTTMRLLAGVLAGQPLAATLDGHEGLRRRPMGRVTGPLALMGARFDGHDGGQHAPFTVHGGALQGIDYALPVASAQVKSALLLAALNAEGETVLHEPAPSRDHTERLLRRLGVPLEREGSAIRCRAAQPWAGAEFDLPGDFSAAAFLLVAAGLVPGSEIVIRDVGLNPTRIGLLDVLLRMGASVEGRVLPLDPSLRAAAKQSPVASDDAFCLRDGSAAAHNDTATDEPRGDLVARSASLRGVEIGGDLVPNLIDELPILAVAATQAHGTTVVRDAAELRVKESDRIAALARELTAMGATFQATADGFVIDGPTPLRGAHVDAHSDHRMAMALAVAGLVAHGETVIEGTESVAKSFPAFAATLRTLGGQIAES